MFSYGRQIAGKETNFIIKQISKYFLWKADNKEKYDTYFTNERNKFITKQIPNMVDV